MRQVDKVVIKTEDFEEATRYGSLPRDVAYVLFIVKDGEFCIQVRRDDNSIIYTSKWRPVIVGDDCIYKIQIDDFSYIGLMVDNDNTVLGGTDYVAFTFYNDLFTEVSTMNDIMRIGYAFKLDGLELVIKDIKEILDKRYT
jgi:hypothetical protein